MENKWFKRMFLAVFITVIVLTISIIALCAYFGIEILQKF